MVSMFRKTVEVQRFSVGSGMNSAARCLFPVALLLIVLATFVPFMPVMPVPGLDPGWAYGINQAVAQHLVFGKEIVFTFGPYASIFSQMYHPATAHMMFWGALYLALSFYILLLVNFRLSAWVVRILLLLALASAMYTFDALIFFYPLLVATSVIRWFGPEHIVDRKTFVRYVILAAMVAPFGLMPLVKGTALIACSVITALSVLILLLNRDWRAAIVAALIPVFSLFLFWWMAGNALLQLPSWLASMLPIISGYSDAMALYGNILEVVAYALITILILRALLSGANGFGPSKKTGLMYLAAFAVILFLTFKSGFIRHDGHEITAGTMVLLIALLLATITSGYQTTMAVMLAALFCFALDFSRLKADPDGTIEWVEPGIGSIVHTASKTFVRSWIGLTQRISDPDGLQRDFEHSVAALRSASHFPLLPGTSDIYSHDQSHLIASGNTWNPRPVLQSYSSYLPVLQEMNRAHLLADHSPDHIFFRIESIDERLPALEDGYSWLTLFTHYRFGSFGDGYLLLNKKNDRSEQAGKFKPLAKQQAVFGELIPIPHYSGLVFIRLHFKPTLYGKLLNILYKPNQLNIHIVMDNQRVHSYRMIASMAESPFLIAPLINSTDDFAALYFDERSNKHPVVRAMLIDGEDATQFWQNPFDVELLGFAKIETK